MVDVLERVELFKPIPSVGLARLAERGRPRSFRAGAVMMRQGDPSEALYAIVSGLVRVERARPGEAPLLLAELGPNEVVGEMGLLDGAPRSATVTAIEDTETLEIHATALSVVLIEYPAVATALLRILSRRLRNTDELVEDMARRQRERF